MCSERDEILVVHLGGLGDVCLAESAFLSLQRHFGDCLAGLGNRRFLDLFSTYFVKTYGVESRHWLYLFSDKLTGPRFRRIIFIGKDRQGTIRKRWAAHSRERLIFIDMYPDGSFPVPEKTTSPLLQEAVHIEDYQVRQVSEFGVEPARVHVRPEGSGPVILYPEKGFSKEKWPPENFLALRDLLAGRTRKTVLLRPANLDLGGEGIVIHELSSIKEFFGRGGIFVSNDSGMAHLAGACGLKTLTIFTDFDPAIWHPRGRNVSLRSCSDDVSPEAVGRLVEALDAKGP